MAGDMQEAKQVARACDLRALKTVRWTDKINYSIYEIEKLAIRIQMQQQLI